MASHAHLKNFLETMNLNITVQRDQYAGDPESRQGADSLREANTATTFPSEYRVERAIYSVTGSKFAKLSDKKVSKLIHADKYIRITKAVTPRPVLAATNGTRLLFKSGRGRAADSQSQENDASDGKSNSQKLKEKDEVQSEHRESSTKV